MADPTKSCTGPLADIGFRKRAGGIFTLALGEDALGWLALSEATRYRPPGEIAINPVVGVRHQGVERVLAECVGEKVHAYLPPTVSTPLGYLMPNEEYTVWVFGSGGETADSQVARELVAAVEQYAVPFMHATAELPELCRRLDERLGIEFQLVFRRPVAHLLAGDPARARAEMDRHLAAIADRTDPAADDYRTFAAALRERIDATANA